MSDTEEIPKTEASATASPPPAAVATPAPEAPVAASDDYVEGGPIQVRLFGRTDVGQVREHNEDNFIVADLTRKSRGLLEDDRVQTVGPRGCLLGVCDGMGGAAAGEVASQLAVDTVFEKMADGEAPKDHDELARRLVRAIEEAGTRIYTEAKNDRTRRGMGTTSTIAALLDDHLFLGQVGDSRAYILRGKRFVQVTRDQSLVNQLIEAGQLTEEEAETFEHNNIILQALGTSDTVQVDLTYVHLRRGDVLLVCSDGLSGMVRSDDLREVLLTSKEPLEACKILTEKANQSGGHDNITCVVARFDGPGLRPAVTEVADPPLPGSEADLKYRKYSLPEDKADASSDHRSMPPRSSGKERSIDHDAAPSKVANTVVGLNARDVFGDGHADDPVSLPVSSTPPWLVGLLVACMLGVVVFMGFYLLR